MLKKLIFKEEIKDIILEYILTDYVKPGERISLPKVASELEVSVTPVREALTQLSETGIVTYIPNRGFFVAKMKAEEAVETYELIAVLESNAVKNASFDNTQLQELRKINSDFVKANNNMEMLAYDRLFHQKLIENYQNKAAKKIIESLRIKIYLYDYAFWNEQQKIDSIEMHNDIINYITANDIASAVDLIYENWIQGIAYVLKQKESNTN